MGLMWHGVKLFCAMRRAGVPLGRVATIGRQELCTVPAKLRHLLIDHGGVAPDRAAQLVPDSTRYAEPICLALGAESVDSIDYSDYEGATIIHDLNDPLPQRLVGQFDFLFDGGTIEHCFDLRAVLRNYMELLRVGGTMIIHTNANNFMGHGFYQLSPEFFYGVFSPENGYRLRRLIMHESFEYAPWYDVPDPAQIRSRIQLANSWVGVNILAYAVREQEVPPLRKAPLQSDYKASWAAQDGSSTPPGPSGQGPQGASPGIKQRIKETLPFLVRAKHRLNDRHPAFVRWLYRWRRAREFHRFSLRAQPDRFQDREGRSQRPG